MENFKEFLTSQALEIIFGFIAIILGFVGIRIKTMVSDFLDTKTKVIVIDNVVKAVEQMYKDLHGEEKLEKAVEKVEDILNDKGIPISGSEMRVLIESAVQQFNTGWATLKSEIDETRAELTEGGYLEEINMIIDDIEKIEKDNELRETLNQIDAMRNNNEDYYIPNIMATDAFGNIDITIKDVTETMTFGSTTEEEIAVTEETTEEETPVVEDEIKEESPVEEENTTEEKAETKEG